MFTKSRRRSCRVVKYLSTMNPPSCVILCDPCSRSLVASPLTFDAHFFESAQSLDVSSCRVIYQSPPSSSSPSSPPDVRLLSALADSVCLISSLSLNMMDFSLRVSGRCRALSQGMDAATDVDVNIVGQSMVQALLDYASEFNAAKKLKGVYNTSPRIPPPTPRCPCHRPLLHSRLCLCLCLFFRPCLRLFYHSLCRRYPSYAARDAAC